MKRKNMIEIDKTVNLNNFLNGFKKLVKSKNYFMINKMIKHISSSLQCDLMLDCDFNKSSSNLYYNALLESFTIDIWDEIKIPAIKININDAPIISWVNSQHKVTNALLTIGKHNNNEYNWEEHKSNIIAVLIEPLNLVLVRNGNHSTNSAIIQGEGFLYANTKIDITESINKYRFDGYRYINIETNRPINRPALLNGCYPLYDKIGFLFEMTRILINENID